MWRVRLIKAMPVIVALATVAASLIFHHLPMRGGMDIVIL